MTAEVKKRLYSLCRVIGHSWARHHSLHHSQTTALDVQSNSFTVMFCLLQCDTISDTNNYTMYLFYLTIDF